MQHRRKDLKSDKDDRFSEETILEIIVTAFVIAILSFFFIKIMYF